MGESTADVAGRRAGTRSLSDWRQPCTLIGADVTLRPLERGDRDAVLAAAADGRSWELFYTGAPGPDTVDAWFERAMSDRDHGRAMPFAAVTAELGVVGSTRFMRMNREHRRVEIGSTFYAAAARRTTVNSESKLLLLTHAFDALGCVCVEFRTDRFNRTSQAAIERIGAVRDGVLRQHYVMPGGRIRDMVVYSISAAEWRGVRENLHFLLNRARSSDQVA